MPVMLLVNGKSSRFALYFLIHGQSLKDICSVSTKGLFTMTTIVV